MTKPTRDYLQDILQYLADIQTFTAGLDEPAFQADRKTQLAVIRAFEVIGEIVKRLPQALLETQSQVNWRAIKGFRDILIHQYDNIDMSLVWDALARVPDVQQAVEVLLNNLPEDESDVT